MPPSGGREVSEADRRRAETAMRDPRGTRPPGRSRALAALAVVGLLLAGLGAGALARHQWRDVLEYPTPYAFELPAGDETSSIVDRVVLFVVDGLRLDTARELPTFRSLGASGSFLVARTGQPSLSLPGWTTLTTGSPPEISGVTTNRYEGPVRLDSVFDAASRSGVRSAIAGGAAWERLYGDVVDTMFTVDDEEAGVSDPRIGAAALRIIEKTDPGLLLVHLPDTDRRGHETGVTRRYRAAARGADAIIAQVVEAGRDGTAFLLTSDHGHIDAGGHGGPEEVVTRVPLVLAGDGLVPGARGEVAQSDVAPTVAALLGIARPSHATGVLRDQLLDVSGDARAEIIAAHDTVASRFYQRAVRVVSGRGDTAASFDAAREQRLRGGILARLPIVLAAIALATIAIVLGSRRTDPLALMAGSGTLFAALAGLFLGRGLGLSFSHLSSEEQVAGFVTARAIDAVIAGLAAAAVAGLVAGRRRHPHGFVTGVATVAWSMLVLGLVVAAYLSVFGLGMAWRLPNLTAAFGQLLALIAMFALGSTAWLGALVSSAAARLVAARRR